MHLLSVVLLPVSIRVQSDQSWYLLEASGNSADSESQERWSHSGSACYWVAGYDWTFAAGGSGCLWFCVDWKSHLWLSRQQLPIPYCFTPVVVANSRLLSELVSLSVCQGSLLLLWFCGVAGSVNVARSTGWETCYLTLSLWWHWRSEKVSMTYWYCLSEMIPCLIESLKTGTSHSSDSGCWLLSVC